MREIARLASLSFFASALIAWGAQPCCEEQDFRGIGSSPDGVKIQLVEVKRLSPEDIRVVWTLKNTTNKTQPLTKHLRGWADGWMLAYDANVTDLDSRKHIKVAKVKGRSDLLASQHAVDHKAGGIMIGPGKTITSWAKFVVPESTTKLAVDLPGATMPWENVAVTQ